MARNIFLSFLPLAVNESNPRPRSVARLSLPDPSGWTAMLIYDATVATPGPDLSVDSEARGHHVVGRFTGPKKWETKPDPVIPSNHHSIVQQSNDSGQDGNHGLRLIGADTGTVCRSRDGSVHGIPTPPRSPIYGPEDPIPLDEHLNPLDHGLHWMAESAIAESCKVSLQSAK